MSGKTAGQALDHHRPPLRGTAGPVGVLLQRVSPTLYADAAGNAGTLD